MGLRAGLLSGEGLAEGEKKQLVVTGSLVVSVSAFNPCVRAFGEMAGVKRPVDWGVGASVNGLRARLAGLDLEGDIG